MDRILTLSARAIAKQIRQGEMTSNQAVSMHIDRIRRVNPVINAVVKDRFDTAIEEAKKADLFIQKKGTRDLPPFFGVPCTIKECFAFTGMPNASGLVARKDVIASQDATAVRRIRDAGAIPMGVTNTSELCMWMESSNKVYGRTNNPYDPKRIVGGSSGGEGAIIGAGGSPFGLGSDIGGSIRMPAFFNGVFGHKPSAGLVPNTGQHPVAVNQALRYLTSGPLTRRAEDLWPLLQILAGPDGKDPSCVDMQLGDPSRVDFSKHKVFVVEDNGKMRVAPDMRSALRKAARAFMEMGATVKTIKIDKLKYSMEIWSSMLSAAGGPSFSELLGNGRPVNSLLELGKWAVGKSDHTLPAVILALIEKGPKLMPGAARRSLKLGGELKEELDEILADDSLLLFPSYPTVAPKHNKPLFPPFNWVYTAILNVMEVPVTQTPMGLNHQGLPMGVQVVAGHGNDHLTVAGALMLEQIFGGWAIPPN